MNTLTYTLKLSNAAFVGPARQAQQALGNIGGAASGAGAGLTRMSGGIAAAAAALGGITAVLAGFKSAISSAANMETMEVSFKNLIGSATGAKDTLQDLSEFAASTPFELPEVVKAAKTLLGAGIAADKLEGSLQSMGNVASAFGADLSTVATITAQVINKSQLYAEEIQQLGENGVPALQLLSDSMGKNKAEVIAMATAGQLGAVDLAKAFDMAGGAGGKFASAMAEQSQTVSGLWSTLQDGFRELGVTIGTPINEHILKPLFNDAIEALPRIKAALEAIGSLLKSAMQVGGLAEVADLLGMALNLAFAKATQYFYESLVTAGDRASTLIGAQLERMFKKAVAGMLLDIGKLPGLPSPLEAMGVKGQAMDLMFGEKATANNLFDLDGMEQAFNARVQALGNGDALKKFRDAWENNLKKATSDGVSGGLTEALGTGSGKGGGADGAGKGRAGGVGDGGFGGMGGGGDMAGGHISRGTIRRGDSKLAGLPEGFTPNEGETLSGLDMHNLLNLRRKSKVPGTTEIGTSKDLVIPIGQGFDQGTDPRRAGFLKKGFGGLKAFEDLQNRARKVGDKGPPTPGQQFIKDKREAAAQQQKDAQAQQQPRWDAVVEIAGHIKKLAVG